MPLPIFVMWLVYFPISPIAEARLPPQIVAWINERPGKYKVPKYMWWDWFDHMQGGKWAGIKWHPNARAVIYYTALGTIVLFMYVTGMLVRDPQTQRRRNADAYSHHRCGRCRSRP